MNDRKRLQMPTGATLEGPRRDRGHMLVKGPGKPPKLRWTPGSFVRLGAQLYEILFCYRVEAEPQEWRFTLEERATLSSEPTDLIGKVGKAFGCGETTPRIVYDVFRDGYSAQSYFMDIPANGDRRTVTNKTMLQEATLVSSGEVL